LANARRRHPRESESERKKASPQNEEEVGTIHPVANQTRCGLDAFFGAQVKAKGKKVAKEIRKKFSAKFEDEKLFSLARPVVKSDSSERD
jgi:hypothetical protein